MDFSWMWWLLIAFVVMSMLKGGRHDRRHRRMQEQLDDLHNERPVICGGNRVYFPLRREAEQPNADQEHGRDAINE